MASSAKTLVIVESPSKAKTIGKFLGSRYKVVASVGHVRDLPKSKLGIVLPEDLKAWAEERNLQVTQDEVYDLIIKKPASPGLEDHPAVLMQAHAEKAERFREIGGNIHKIHSRPPSSDFGKIIVFNKA